MRGCIPLRLLSYFAAGVALAAFIAPGVGDATIDRLETAKIAAEAAPDPVIQSPVQAPLQVGIASWYGRGHQGKLTASGRPFDRRKLTAAHPSLPFNTKAKVTNLDNGRSVEVTINDRGPGVPGRAIDVSERAAQKLGMKKEGLAPVVIEPLQPGKPKPVPPLVATAQGTERDRQP